MKKGPVIVDRLFFVLFLQTKPMNYYLQNNFLTFEKI